MAAWQWLGAGAIGVVAGVFAILVAVGAVAPDEMAAILAVVMVAAVAAGAVLRPAWFQRTLGRLSTVKVGGLELGLVDLAAEADVQLDPDREGDEADGEPDEDVPDLDEVQRKLEARLAYIATRLLPENERLLWAAGAGQPYATFGSLRSDGYLSAVQAKLASRLVGLDEDRLALLPPAERRALLRTGWDLAGEVRSRVFASICRKVLLQERMGGVRRAGPSKRGLWAEPTPDRRVLVWPCLALSVESDLVGRARTRARTVAGPGDRTVIVVPNESELARATPPDAAEPVVRLDDLIAAVRARPLELDDR